jgi:hypothetical protein
MFERTDLACGCSATAWATRVTLAAATVANDCLRHRRFDGAARCDRCREDFPMMSDQFLQYDLLGSGAST